MMGNRSEKTISCEQDLDRIELIVMEGIAEIDATGYCIVS